MGKLQVTQNVDQKAKLEQKTFRYKSYKGYTL